MPNDPLVQTNINLPHSIKERIDAIAHNRRVSRGTLIREAVELWLSTQSNKEE